jgi:arginine:pyruvate transaminase
MRYASITERLADLGGEKWLLYSLARQMAQDGRDIIEMTIGEPDVPTPPELIAVACEAMAQGRTKYSNGRGEPEALQALSKRYTASAGRPICDDQILCFPGTQTALYAALMAVTEAGDDVLVGDPMYATYAGLIAASGARMVPVPLRPENGFQMTADDIVSKLTPRSRAILLNSPHNPTGAVLSKQRVQDIVDLAQKHDLWILSDEVYDEMLFVGARFTSPLSFPNVADRVVVVSSISKSHAAPGFRSGWSVGSADFTKRLLPLAETMLFGNQPFIADMTAVALSQPSRVAADMRQRFAGRAGRMFARLDGVAGLRVSQPEAGMFVLIDVSKTGLNGEAYAYDLLEKTGVAVMPGSAFGALLDGWVRVALTVEDDAFDRACQRIADHALTCAQASVEVRA